MRFLIEKFSNCASPTALVERLRGEPAVVLLHSSLGGSSQARYSFVTARPFLTFQSKGCRCETRWAGNHEVSFGDPWALLELLLGRYELLEQLDFPFPLGGCFGCWGYELKNFIEPRLPHWATDDLELPDCHVAFYDSLVAYDHQLGTSWIISTGLRPDGSRSKQQAEKQWLFWSEKLSGAESAFAAPPMVSGFSNPCVPGFPLDARGHEFVIGSAATEQLPAANVQLVSNLTRRSFLENVHQAQQYIRSGDIYQVNLSQRLTAALHGSPWELFQALTSVSPAPFSAYLDIGDFQLVSSSPELFLRMSGSHIATRPIKGTRPRSADSTTDSQLGYQLQTSAKEVAELVMITDLLRNDLGRVCEFGSVQVPELIRLERYPQVQHLVSTVQGLLQNEVSQLKTLAACFPGGSITGAPKIRAMEIIDELESISRGPYTGALGYLGFNRESQLSIVIRTALCKGGLVHFPVGAGIVADSVPEAEYEETLTKARGFAEALRFCSRPHDRISQRQVRS